MCGDGIVENAGLLVLVRGHEVVLVQLQAHSNHIKIIKITLTITIIIIIITIKCRYSSTSSLFTIRWVVS